MHIYIHIPIYGSMIYAMRDLKVQLERCMATFYHHHTALIQVHSCILQVVWTPKDVRKETLKPIKSVDGHVRASQPHHLTRAVHTLVNCDVTTDCCGLCSRAV